jgi:lipoprotein-anchoring transpeptidase ErfK/SrfK
MHVAPGGVDYRTPMRWRFLVPVVAAFAVLGALVPVAAADDTPVATPTTTTATAPAATPATPAPPPPAGPASGALQATGLQMAARQPVKQIGPYIPPAPPVPANTGAGRRVVYCNSCQYVWVIDENDNVVRSYVVSGRQYMPGPGVYHIFVKQRYTFATNNPTITWEYMVTFTYGPNGGGIGFHEIPWQYGHPEQTEAQLGQFLSGGCVRQAHVDAVWMWEWSRIGDTVVVTA